MKTLTDFPVKHIEENLAFGRDGTVWAYYEIEGFDYDFRDPEQKMIPFLNQMTFLTKNRYDFHYLLIPYQMEVAEIIERTIRSVKRRSYALRDHGIRYLENLKREVGQGLTKNENQYHGYLGVQLDVKRNRYKEGNAGNQFISSAKSFLEGLNSPVRQAVGLDPYDILKVELDAWKEQAELVGEEVATAFSSPSRSLSTAELLFITEYGFSLESERTAMEPEEESETVTGIGPDGEKVEAVRPNRNKYYDLQNAVIDWHDGRTLKVKKVVDDEEQEQLVKYLVVDKMNPENWHPGFEWLYQLQTDLSFPVGISIRAFHKPNRRVRKELSNALLDFTDQKEEAERARMNKNRNLESSEEGAMRMEQHFEETGHPGYNCSFVFRVTGASVSELKMRVTAVRDMLDRYGISVQSPYGDALRYFMEFVPSGTRVTDDYWQPVSPGMLANMMFGATTNIGDNRGFLIGFTKKLRKPVFIQPDLAAKGYRGVHNLTDSLAVMVAGETGKGKSLFMNLYSTLSALTLGSQVLIIDPKGDRENWADGLPFVPKEFISIWKLGENDEDAGSLDPFRTATDLGEAKDIWMDVGSHIMDLDLGPKYDLLSEAVEVAGEHPDPCSEVIMDYLENQYENPPEGQTPEKRRDLEELIGALKTARRNRLSKLLFGRIGQNYRSLDVKKPMQILMVQNLVMPNKKKNGQKSRPAEKISEAIMISITAFTKQFTMKTDKKTHKIIFLDEAASIEKSEMGATMIDWLQRMGRTYNNTLLKATQNATDYEDANNIGMKASFRLPQEEEARRMLSFYNLPLTNTNIKTLQRLRKGECLFQDIYGRSAVVAVNTIFKQFVIAFDTTTSDEEEREMEELETRETIEV